MRKLFPLLAFAAIGLISLAMSASAYVAAQDATRIKFEARADDALSRIESRLDLHVSLLRATRAFVSSHPDQVTQREFKAFFDSLNVGRNFSGLRGLGLLGLSGPGGEPVLEKTIERFHGAGRAIYPASSEPLRTPILLFEPLDAKNKDAIGFDMFSDPGRRDAIVTALQTGQPRVSHKVLLGQQIGGEVFPGFLVFARLGGDGFDVANPGQPKAEGLLYAAFRADDLFKAALDKLPLLPVSIQVFDGEAQPENLLFESATPPSQAIGMDFAATRQLMVEGSAWTVRLRPTTDFSPPSSPAIPVMLGLFGLLFAGAIALVARYQSRAYDAISLLQEAGEKSLVEKDLMLQEMKHRIKNSIARVLAIARQTASNSKDIAEFSASFAARLQAMAASQDMLTRSRWQKADLEELLRIELGQVFGKELPAGMLRGPKLLLSENETQALGLTFHELATNALKYGEAGSSQDALTVRWSLKGKNMVLVWTEVGKKVAKPEKTGFGTKLIDMNIKLELNGTISRSYGDDGIQIVIEVPLAAGEG